MLNKLKDEAVFYGALDDWMVPIVTQLGDIGWTLSMLNYYLLPHVYVLPNSIETRALTVDDVPLIIEHAHYKQFLSEEYLTQRITNSHSAGIDFDGNLAAWGMTHDDGSIGVVHVMDGHRRKGYGKEVVISLVHKIRESGKIPFAQIEKSNIASLWLFEKLGFVMDRQLTWIKLEL